MVVVKKIEDPTAWISFSEHAKKRLEQFGLGEKQARKMIRSGIVEKVPHAQMKAEKYHGNEGAIYRTYGPFSFVLKTVPHKSKPTMMIWWVITVGDKRQNIRYRDDSWLKNI